MLGVLGVLEVQYRILGHSPPDLLPHATGLDVSLRGEVRTGWRVGIAGGDAVALIAVRGLLLEKDTNALLYGVWYCREGYSAVSAGLLS